MVVEKSLVTGYVTEFIETPSKRRAECVRRRLENLYLSYEGVHWKAEIIERDAEDDAEKTTEGVCGH